MILRSITVASLTFQTFLLCIPGGSASQVRHHGVYHNRKYGYSFRIPDGLAGFSDAAPAPQHGITLALTDDSKEQIWIDGSYNAALWPTVKEALKENLEWLHRDADHLNHLDRWMVDLGPLRAIRDIDQYSDRQTGESMVQDLTIAIRNADGDGQIVYTIGLQTRKRDYDKQKLLVDEIIRRWRLESLPK